MANDVPTLPTPAAHPARVEIARYLLSRGAFLPPDMPKPATRHPLKTVEFPAGLAPERITIVADHAALGVALRADLRPGDLVLLKGSRGAALERVLPALTGEPDRR